MTVYVGLMQTTQATSYDLTERIALFGGRIKACGWLFPGLMWLRFWTTCPHSEFPTPAPGGGNVWPSGEYTPPGTPPSVPLTPDEMASVFCNYSIPAPKCVCQNSSEVSDSYPTAAKSICIDFLKRYQFSIAVISTAMCLANAESQCQNISCCSERNNCRLKAHINCYASRGFVPFLGLPEGGADVGWNMLLNDSQCK